MARDNWYRLDNVGKYYSSQAGSSAQTVFRCSATLVEDIDPDALQRALDSTVGEFPGFNVCLRSGMFWHYLERSDAQPLVTPENLPICYGLHVDTKSILFRVTYHHARINLEVSHILSDGRGGVGFLAALLSHYVQERYAVDAVSDRPSSSDFQKAENSYDKYYEKGKAGSTRAPAVFRIPGWRDAGDPTFMEYHLSTRSVLELAHEANVSLTSFITAAAICAVRDEMPRRDRNRAIRLDIPVDLRKFFESSTAKNFFGLAYVTYVPGDADEPLEDIAVQVQAQIEAATEPEALKARMNHMIAMEKNPFLRVAPIFFKDFVLDIANRTETRKTTMTVSNLGPIRLPDAVAAYVRDVNIMTSTTHLSFEICSYGDDLSIGISTIYLNPDVVKNFCRIFSNRGIEGHINGNKTHDRRLVVMSKNAGRTATDATL